MSDPIENFRIVLEQRNAEQRTIIPGLIDGIDREAERERDATFAPGPGDLVAGEPVTLPLCTDVPMLTMAGGGFFFCLPTASGDEALGLVSDRPIGEYVESRSPGAQSRIDGRAYKTTSSMLLTPFSITAPEGAPDTWDSLLLGGPAGVGIQIDADGTVTITGQAEAPVTPTTIVMQPGGDITLTVGTGNSVNIGGAGATALALGQKVIDTIDAAWAAATPTANDGGAGLKTTWLATWNGIKNTILALIAKGV